MLLIIVYIETSVGAKLYFVIYVDHILLATKDLSMSHKTKDILSKNFEMKDMEEASFCDELKYFVINHKDYWVCFKKLILKNSREV